MALCATSARPCSMPTVIASCSATDVEMSFVSMLMYILMYRSACGFTESCSARIRGPAFASTIRRFGSGATASPVRPGRGAGHRPVPAASHAALQPPRPWIACVAPFHAGQTFAHLPFVLQIRDGRLNISILSRAIAVARLVHRPSAADLQRREGENMSGALEELFARVDEEFGVDISGASQGTLKTPGDVIEYLLGETEPSDGMSPEEHRDHLAAVLGELMAQTLGVTRYSENSRFLQDLHVR